MLKLELINYFLQLFFIRLVKIIDLDTYKEEYTIMYFVIPFTGWNSEFKFLGKEANYYSRN